MNTKSYTAKKIKESFDQLFDQFSEEEKLEAEARLIMFRFLDIIERKCEQSGLNRKQLAEKMGTSASYITQLFRGDKLINMNTLAKFQEVLDLEFDIREKRNYENSLIDYSPKGDEGGVWVYRNFSPPNYDSAEKLSELPKEPAKVVA